MDAGEFAQWAFAAVVVVVFDAFSSVLARLIFLTGTRVALARENGLNELIVQMGEVVNLKGERLQLVLICATVLHKA